MRASAGSQRFREDEEEEDMHHAVGETAGKVKPTDRRTAPEFAGGAEQLAGEAPAAFDLGKQACSQRLVGSGTQSADGRSHHFHADHAQMHQAGQPGARNALPLGALRWQTGEP